MKRIKLSGFIVAVLLFSFSSQAQEWNRPAIKQLMKRVADWQIEHQKEVKHTPTNWTNAALYVGMAKWAGIAEKDGDSAYFEWLTKIARRAHWQLAPRTYHADDIAVAQLYTALYRKYKKEQMLIPTLIRADGVIRYPSSESFELDYGKPETLERWTWCDALYMAPPVYLQLYTITGDKKYIRFMDKEFKVTYDYLYDKDEDLFYRDWRYFKQKEANGEKVFWGRGNGWVIAGLCEMLEELPAKNKYRKFYEELFVRLANRLAGLQQNDGFWRASLLDPDSYPAPETSATGFIVYAMAYGVNQGLLPADTFLPVIRKGRAAMVAAVEEDGKLGYVQPIGADPKSVTREMTEVYGVGAFLSAGSEIYKMVE